jgi:hypothetical protein
VTEKVRKPRKPKPPVAVFLDHLITARICASNAIAELPQPALHTARRMAVELVALVDREVIARGQCRMARQDNVVPFRRR